MLLDSRRHRWYARPASSLNVPFEHREKDNGV